MRSAALAMTAEADTDDSRRLVSEGETVSDEDEPSSSCEMDSTHIQTPATSHSRNTDVEEVRMSLNNGGACCFRDGILGLKTKNIFERKLYCVMQNMCQNASALTTETIRCNM